MKLTAELLKASGRLTKKGERASGVWEIEPPLQIIANVVSEDGGIKKDRVYLASKYSEDGKYPGHIHLHPTASHWWPIEIFELADVQSN